MPQRSSTYLRAFSALAFELGVRFWSIFMENPSTIRRNSVRVEPNPMLWSWNYSRFVNCPTPWWLGPQLRVALFSTGEKNSRRQMAAAIHLPWAFSRRAYKLRACDAISALSGSLLTNLILIWLGSSSQREVDWMSKAAIILETSKCCLVHEPNLRPYTL